MDIFVGDRVRIPSGQEGYVAAMETWRDRVVHMGEAEAREFCDRCRIDAGAEYKQRWGWAEVKVGEGAPVRVPVWTLVVVEGRDRGR